MPALLKSDGHVLSERSKGARAWVIDNREASAQNLGVRPGRVDIHHQARLRLCLVEDGDIKAHRRHVN